MAILYVFSNARIVRLLALLLLLSAGSEGAAARHLDDELTEPIFTERSYVENNVGLESFYETEKDGKELEFAAEGNYVLGERFQIGVEIPVGFTFPDEGDNERALSDIEFSTQFLICCGPGELLDFFSLRAEVAVLSGDRNKDIGGDGSFGFSLLAGRLITVTESLPDLGVQIQLGYEQQIRLNDEQREAARELGLSRKKQKEVLWNVALTQNYEEWRIQPVLEVLGTTIVDALESSEEDTIVEIGGGFWWTPFPDGQGLKSLDIALGGKAPVTNSKESDFTAVIIFDWAF